MKEKRAKRMVNRPCTCGDRSHWFLWRTEFDPERGLSGDVMCMTCDGNWRTNKGYITKLEGAECQRDTIEKAARHELNLALRRRRVVDSRMDALCRQLEGCKDTRPVKALGLRQQLYQLSAQRESLRERKEELPGQLGQI